jgi:ABC-2 type transport system ATP-binding protein
VTPTPRGISLDRVSVTYRPSRRGAVPVEALCGVSVELPPGAIIGLVGANGAGKTTLLEVLAGALRPTTGGATINGNTAGRATYRQVGFAPDVPKFPTLLTGREALMLCAGLTGVAAGAAEQKLRALESPLELAPVLDRRVGGLSRGNLQKLGLAQAVLRSPDLLLCDEPFSALDPVVQVGLREVLLAEASRGACVLVSSHQLDQVEKVAGRVLVLEAGRLVADLTARELQAGWLVELECPGVTAEFEAELRKRWSFVARTRDLFTIPWPSPTPELNEVVRALPTGCGQPTIRRTVPLSLESLLLATLGRH